MEVGNHYQRLMSPFIDKLGDSSSSSNENVNEGVKEFYQKYVQLMRNQFAVISSQVKSFKQLFENSGKANDVVFTAIFS